MAKVEPFEKYSNKFEDWFTRNRYVYASEISVIKETLPEFNNAIEIGVGSGRFAEPLGITKGLEPSEKMAEIARGRGISVIEGIAENIPFDDDSFDLALMVTTLCFLDNVEKAFSEVYRILEPGGYFINGFVDKDSKLGKIYQKIKNKSVFYKKANFYSIEEVKEYLRKTGFTDFSFNQTIFEDIDDIKKIEKAKKGYGSGSFIAISARKPEKNGNKRYAET